MFESMFHAPVKCPQTILDIGCGTGAVTYDLATSYPSARVYGLDISPVPDLRPKQPNTTFLQGDVRTSVASDERFHFESLDYIYCRLLVCGMTDWAGYVQIVARMLRPGGWAEMHETSWNMYQHGCLISDGWGWLDELRKSAEKKDMDIHCGKKVSGWMKQAGLVDVTVIEYKTPIGTWAIDARPETRRLGEYFETWMIELYWHLIAKVLGDEQSEEQIERFRTQMTQDLKPEDGKYWMFYVTTGKKPSSDDIEHGRAGV